MQSSILPPIFATLLISVLLTPQTVYAHVSGNVGLSNDYRFRGITQNAQSFAIQGGFDYENDNGSYAGLWSSSVDFQVQAVDDAATEMDLYAGWTGKFDVSGIAWDVGFLHYNYPSAASSLAYNFTEVNGSLSYQWVTLSYAYSNDYFAGSGKADYINVATSFAVKSDWSVGASIGHQAVEFNSVWGTPDWTDYKIYVAKSYKSFSFELAFIDTDLSSSQCFSGSDWCDSTLTFTVSEAFE